MPLSQRLSGWFVCPVVGHAPKTLYTSSSGAYGGLWSHYVAHVVCTRCGKVGVPR